MSTSIEAKIIDGLLERFGTVTLPVGVSVAYPNVAFTPDGTSPYVRLTIAKNTPVTASLSGGREPIRMGLFMVTVYWPVGAGIIAPSELAGTIRDAFAFGAKWVSNDGVEFRIVEEPTVKGDLVDGVYTEIPVVIPWHVYP